MIEPIKIIKKHFDLKYWEFEHTESYFDTLIVLPNSKDRHFGNDVYTRALGKIIEPRYSVWNEDEYRTHSNWWNEQDLGFQAYSLEIYERYVKMYRLSGYNGGLNLRTVKDIEDFGEVIKFSQRYMADETLAKMCEL